MDYRPVVQIVYEKDYTEKEKTKPLNETWVEITEQIIEIRTYQPRD